MRRNISQHRSCLELPAPLGFFIFRKTFLFQQRDTLRSICARAAKTLKPIFITRPRLRIWGTVPGHWRFFPASRAGAIPSNRLSPLINPEAPNEKPGNQELRKRDCGEQAISSISEAWPRGYPLVLRVTALQPDSSRPGSFFLPRPKEQETAKRQTTSPPTQIRHQPPLHPQIRRRSMSSRAWMWI